MNFKQFYEFKREVFCKIRTICDLSFINPTLELPDDVLQQFCALLKQGNGNKIFSYGSSGGSSECLITVANFWNSLTCSNYHYDSFLVTNGTKDGLALVFKTLSLPGQTVYFEKPTYPMYYQLARSFNLKPTVNVQEADFVVLSAPNNPNGQVNWEILNELSNAKPHQTVFFDGVYVPLCESGGEFLKQLRCKAKSLIESFSFSKAFAVPGARAGFLVGSRQLIENLKRARGFLDYHVSKLVQTFMVSLIVKSDQIINTASHSYRHKHSLFKSFGFESLIKSEEGLPFLWLSHPLVNKDFWEKLAFQGFLTLWGGFHGPEFSNCLRVSLSAPEVSLARFCQLLIDELGASEIKAANA